MENTPNTPETFNIPDFRFGDFVARFAKANKKAKRFGCAPVTYEVVGKTTIKVEAPEGFDGDCKTYDIPASVIQVRGVAPQVGDHDLLARIEYLSDSKSKLFHTVPGSDVKVDERFRDLTAGTCEHCNALRLRRDTFVVRNRITGEQKQVGRNCLADFIGGLSPERIAAVCSYIKLFDDLATGGEHGFGGYFHDRVDTVKVLKLTSAYISLYGWVPKSQGEFLRPTASRVADHFVLSYAHFTPEEKAEVTRVAELSEQPVHIERATEVVRWIKNDLAPVAKSDYELNLCTLVIGELTERRHLGIVCSAVSAYQRSQNREVEYAKRKIDAAKSEFVGTVGERLRDLSVVVTFVKGMASHFGAMTLVKFVDGNGNIMTWFASGDRAFEVGQRLTITGTVKKHNEYQGAKETQLTRVK